MLEVQPSYENLRTWRGVTYVTFRQACEAMGLVELDKSLDDCLTESAQFRMLVHCEGFSPL